MADFSEQQKAILSHTARHNLIHSTFKTGKTAVLIRRYLTTQMRPGAPKAVFLTANALATRRVIDHLKRITALDWQNELIGTIAEIGAKLVLRYFRELAYNKAPTLTSDLAVANEQAAARRAALALHADTGSAVFKEQRDQAFVQILRRKGLATPSSLAIEAINLLTKLIQPELAAVQLLIADNVHDFDAGEVSALLGLAARMNQTFLAGNINQATEDRLRNLDPEHWLSLVHHEQIVCHALKQTFGLGQAQALFLQQLAAYNSKRIYEGASVAVEPQGQMLLEITVRNPRQMSEVVLELENQMQLSTRGMRLAIVMRHANDAREFARILRRPCYLQRDKHQLWHRAELPERGIVVTTPYESAYLSPDYVVLPNCVDGYWPYAREHNSENCRRAFMRSVGSANKGAFFLVPAGGTAILPSPFLSEACTPKLVTKQIIAGSKVENC